MQTSTPPPKPPKPRPPRPVESFGPEILSALLKGATTPTELEMSYKMGVRFRLRIHQLREAMRRANHEKYPLVARVRVTIEWPDGTPTEKSGRWIVPVDRSTKCKVTLKPNDAEFASFLTAAGIEPLGGVDEADLPELDEASPDMTILEELLRDVK